MGYFYCVSINSEHGTQEKFLQKALQIFWTKGILSKLLLMGTFLLPRVRQAIDVYP